jgi:hypothetical protein
VAASVGKEGKGEDMDSLAPLLRACSLQEEIQYFVLRSDASIHPRLFRVRMNGNSRVRDGGNNIADMGQAQDLSLTFTASGVDSQYTVLQPQPAHYPRVGQ